MLKFCIGNWGLGIWVSLGTGRIVNVELIVIMFITGDLVNFLLLGRSGFLILFFNNLGFFIDIGESFFGVVKLYEWSSLMSDIVNGLLGDKSGIRLLEYL